MSAMSPRERLSIMIRTDRGSMTVWSPGEVRDALDAYRAAVLREAQREVVAWLDKKAGEYRSTGSQQHRLQADAVETMASKVDRGAIRLFLAAGKDAPAGGESTRLDIPPLYVADYEGAPLTLHLTREAARDACDDFAKLDAHGRCWDWRTEDGDIDRQFWTHADDDSPVGYTGGAVWEISVEQDAAGAAGKDTPPRGESTRDAETCGRCRLPFDSADTRFDGRARYRDTPFCGGCVDRCHESTDAGHRCPVCTAGGGDRG